ncbi:MAG: hypothetical protein ACTHLE_23100 [Agriterribacter sp.]
MKRKEDIQQELTGISPKMAEFNHAMPFEAPSDSYFEAFPGKMLGLIHHLESNTSLPAQEEITILSPLLANIKNKQPFEVPDHYFEQFQKNITEQLERPAAQPAKVVRMNSSPKSWVRYAIAVAVIGFVGIAALFWNNLQSDANQTLATKPAAAGDTLSIPQLPEETLAGYLKGLPDNIYEPSIDSADSEFYDVALLKIDDTKLGNMLEDVPEEDLTLYAKEL